MNLTLKPEKYKNLSICSGSPKIVPFSLGGKDLDSIKNSPMKFLGACVSFQSTSMECFTFTHNKLESMLKNIESTKPIEMYIRGLTNNAKIISDLPGRSLSGLYTIPPEVLVTSARPDIVIHYSDANAIKIIELTVPFETNTEKEHTFKTNKYATLHRHPSVSEDNGSVPPSLST